MFTELHQIMGTATISLTIQRTGLNELTVAITPKTSGSDLVPAVMVGTPSELDEKFADSINGLIQDAEIHFLKKSAQTKSMKEPEKTSTKTEAKKPEQAIKPPVSTPVKETAPKEVEATLDLF